MHIWTIWRKLRMQSLLAKVQVLCSEIRVLWSIFNILLNCDLLLLRIHVIDLTDAIIQGVATTSQSLVFLMNLHFDISCGVFYGSHVGASAKARIRKISLIGAELIPCALALTHQQLNIIQSPVRYSTSTRFLSSILDSGLNLTEISLWNEGASQPFWIYIFCFLLEFEDHVLFFLR